MVADGGAVMEPACASEFRVGDQYCSHSKKIREKNQGIATEVSNATGTIASRVAC
jgi:hypothetical protein